MQTILYETVVKYIPVVASYNVNDGEVDVLSIRSKVDNSMVLFDDYSLMKFTEKCKMHYKSLKKAQ